MSIPIRPQDVSQKRLLLPGFLLLPVTFAAFYFLPQLLGKTAGYLASFVLYWSWCIVHGLVLKKGDVVKRYSWPPHTSTNILWAVLCFLPVIGAFTAAFLVAYPFLSPELYLMLALAALTNGFVEEFYWRGAYTSRYGQNKLYAFVLPTLLFGLWHISVYAAYGISYQGGFLPLVGGAFFMGLIWGYTAFRQQRILIPTLAHILTNFFAFSNLIVENWIR
ncbi:CPBP family intramembrane metalloprotease [Pontibacter sp. FD36]|uniref:CPBP family intramembrane glutamic endopeptidase n=1 Tax=Pontibacter sp. FD36 TaxID=2789860 RepID=UPI0018A8A452|nr:CPBP family intramembrane glutamic endopeptidase [Pontibacter sp. FD36]MBF8962561.1 CPBP family intramembrane metalloprotease [Pontibacter sp. FD36]